MSKKLVYGVGINDLPGWSTSSNSKRRWISRVWYNMICRCYGKKQYPTYKGCTVCDRWLTFSNFVADAPLLPGFDVVLTFGFKGVALDKDSLVVGNKEYSPDTCCWLTRSENTHERYVRCGNPLSDPEVARKSAMSQGHPVIAIAPDGAITEFYGAKECSRQLGVDYRTVRNKCNVTSGSHTLKKGKWKGWSFYWKEDYNEI